MLDDSNVLLSSYNRTNSGLAYRHIVKATNNYTTANTAMVNAIKMASTKEEAQAIRDAVIIGQNGKATTWGKRYSQSADEAERDRVQRIDSDNNKARLAQVRGVKERTLAAFNDGQIPAMIAENPFAADKRLTDLFASVGEPVPTYLKQEIANVSTGFNEDEINRYTRSGAEVPEERINRAKGTHQTKLKALNEAAQLRKFGGDLGKKALSALDAIAKEEHKIGVDGATTPDAVLTGSAFKRRWMDIWKEQGFGSQDPTTNAAEIAKTTAILNEERAKDKDNPQGRFYSKPDATNNSVVFPNLFPSTKDYQQLKTLVDKKFAAGRSIGEIASTPSLLATPAELATLSQQSQTSNNFRYPPLIMYAAAKNKNAPSEIANEQIKANNLAFGENTPLIQPNIVTKAMDEASLADAKLMNSLYVGQRNRGGVNYLGTTNMPGNIRSSMIGPTGALTYEANKQAYVNIGTAMQSAGFQIGEHSAFDQVDPVHAGNSYHNYDEAFDITHQTGDYNTSIAKTKQLKELIRSMNIFKEVIGPGDGDPNHATHLHLGGLLRPITQEELDLINSIN